MAYSTIEDPSAHFQATTYTGAGAGQTVTNDGNSDLKPDFLWIKRRNAGYAHFVVDSNRNISYAQNSSNPPYLETDSSATENSNQNWISGVGTDGFTIGINEQNLSNTSGTYVAWQWKANGGTTSSNTDGDITTTVQVNSTAGFSIITDSPGNNTARTIGHGLGAKPDFIIRRARNRGENWNVYHSAFESTLPGGWWGLDTDAAYNDGATSGFTSMSNTTFGVGTDYSVNGNYNYVTYAWKEVQGYSKFGKYPGNSDTDGPFVYCGFKPAFILLKKTSSGDGWFMLDSARDVGNFSTDKPLRADTTGYEGSTTKGLDILSNGFKLRSNDGAYNGSGKTYIYMAFAEQPLVANGIPTTAR